MKRVILYFLVGVFLISADLSPSENRLATKLDLHWTAEIGLTTHRTKVAFLNGKLYIGSNGKHLRDYAIDSGNGVHVLNQKTGKKIRSFANESFGDMDVNGILKIKQNLIFGNDNDEVICVDSKGKQLWRVPTSGDVEHKPAHVRSKGQDLAVFATETGEIRALNAQTGASVWSYYHPSFRGWKQGDNRFVFKVKMHFTAESFFFNEPALADLNLDGVNDLIYNCRWGNLMAFSGKTGKLLWNLDKKKFKGFRSTMGRERPVVTGKGNTLRIYALYSSTNGGMTVLFDRKGKVKKKVLNSKYLGSPLLSQVPNHIITNRKIIKLGITDYKTKVISPDWTYKGESNTDYARFREGQVAPQTFKFNNEECALIVFQYDMLSESRQAAMVIIGLNTGTMHMRTPLPSFSEFTPVVKDINKDGNLDVLVGCDNKKLYCFDLKIPAKNLIK